MKEMIKRVREDKGGFTLAELLVVVAIIGVLVAIAIPVFSAVTGQAQVSAAEANMRVARAEASVEYLEKGETTSPLFYTVVMTSDGKVESIAKAGSAETAIGTAADAAAASGSIVSQMKYAADNPGAKITIIVEVREAATV